MFSLFNWLLVISNLVFIWPLVWAWKRKLIFETFLSASALFHSVLWHLCRDIHVCLITFQAHEFMDHFFSFLVFPTIVVYLMSIGDEFYKVLLNLSYGTILIMLFAAFGVKFFLIFILSGLAVIIAIIYFWKIRSRKRKLDYSIPQTILGILVVGIGCLFFLLMKPRFITHSLWHVFGSLGVYIILKRHPTLIPPILSYHIYPHSKALEYEQENEEKVIELDLDLFK